MSGSGIAVALTDEQIEAKLSQEEAEIRSLLVGQEDHDAVRLLLYRTYLRGVADGRRQGPVNTPGANNIPGAVIEEIVLMSNDDYEDLMASVSEGGIAVEVGDEQAAGEVSETEGGIAGEASDGGGIAAEASDEGGIAREAGVTEAASKWMRRE